MNVLIGALVIGSVVTSYHGRDGLAFAMFGLALASEFGAIWLDVFNR